MPTSLPKKPTAKKAPAAKAKASKSTAKKSTPIKKSAPIAQKTNNDNIEKLSLSTIFKIWYDGWKKTFVLRSRSSRFEAWCFLFINTIFATLIRLQCNYILSPRFLRHANDMKYNMDTIEQYIIWANIFYYIAVFVPLLPIGSLLIRRMHDLGRSAWKKCLEPIFMSMVVLWVLFLALNYINDTDYVYTAMLLGSCFFTILYAGGYYTLKFLIITLFYEGPNNTNKYGTAKYNEPEYEEWALKFSCFYFLFVITLGIISLVFTLV